MSVLVDTGVLYADHDTSATRHESASQALDAVFDGRFGQPYVSDYIYDEVITLTLKRSGSHAAATALGRRIRGVDPYPNVYEWLRVSSAVFADAIEVFERFDDQRLSFTDVTTVALTDRYDIDHVLSFDDDFDGLVDRLDPASM